MRGYSHQTQHLLYALIEITPFDLIKYWVYGRTHAVKVVRAAIRDYAEYFGGAV